jgi:hypothetical protein
MMRADQGRFERQMQQAIGMALAMVAIAAIPPAESHAQPIAGAAPEEAPTLEALPQHLALRVEQTEPVANADALKSSPDDLNHLQWIYQKSLMWVPGQTLKVCFIGGDPALNKRVVAAASEWTKHANLDFDAGDPANPTSCSKDDRSEIRIGYGYKGYWSLLGQTSVDFSVVGPGEQSMNFGGWSYRPPAPAELQRVVQHEFGHAIGLQHEHQNPAGGCDSEFNWNALYPMLAGPPNFWDKKTVDNNLRAIPDSRLIERSEHDRLSIMHYSFRPDFFNGGAASSCYVQVNFQISQKDIEGVKAAYPSSGIAAALGKRADAIEAVSMSLRSNQERSVKQLSSDLGKRVLELRQAATELK